MTPGSKIPKSNHLRGRVFFTWKLSVVKLDICVEALDVMFTSFRLTVNNQPAAEEAAMLKGRPPSEGIAPVTQCFVASLLVSIDPFDLRYDGGTFSNIIIDG